MTPTVLATWAELLVAVPNSALLLKSDIFYVEAHCEAFECRFLAAARSRVGPGLAEALRGRLRLVQYKSCAREHYEAYALMDVALDTFPYAGTTTTVRRIFTSGVYLFGLQ